MAAAAAPSEPVIVYTGPTKTGEALVAANVADTEQQTVRRGKKGRAAGKKPVATAEAKTDAKDTKPAPRVSVTIDPNAPIKRGARHATAKPDAAAARPADKPVAAAAKPAPRPAKPTTAAKPAIKPAPKNSTTGEARPAAGQTTAAAPRS
jgi:D-alanyl-D-alanine carboxypeptidase